MSCSCEEKKSPTSGQLFVQQFVVRHSIAFRCCGGLSNSKPPRLLFLFPMR